MRSRSPVVRFRERPSLALPLRVLQTDGRAPPPLPRLCSTACRPWASRGSWWRRPTASSKGTTRSCSWTACLATSWLNNNDLIQIASFCFTCFTGKNKLYVLMHVCEKAVDAVFRDPRTDLQAIHTKNLEKKQGVPGPVLSLSHHLMGDVREALSILFRSAAPATLLARDRLSGTAHMELLHLHQSSPLLWHALCAGPSLLAGLPPAAPAFPRLAWAGAWVENLWRWAWVALASLQA